MPAKKPFTLDYRQDPNGPGSPHQWRGAFHHRLGGNEAWAVVGSESPYAILGVSPLAAWGEIRKAYRRLVKKHHPDVQETATSDALTFRKVQAAYELLEEAHARRP